MVYSQYRGESRSFALTHAQGGELSLSFSSLQAVNYSGGARGRFVTRSREDIVKFLPFSGTPPFSHSSSSSSSSSFFCFSFLFFRSNSICWQWDEEKGERKRRTNAPSPLIQRACPRETTINGVEVFEPRRVSYYVQLARDSAKREGYRAVQGLAAVWLLANPLFIADFQRRRHSAACSVPRLVLCAPWLTHACFWLPPFNGVLLYHKRGNSDCPRIWKTDPWFFPW